MTGMKSLKSALIAAALAVSPALGAPPAAPEDVHSIDAIMTAVYDVISGEAGEARDWDRFRSLFIEGARLIPRAPAQPAGARVWSPEDYITIGGPGLVANGFIEEEIGRHVDQYGDIAQVFSAYAAKRKAADAAPFVRGVNSFQLMKHEGRWWVVSIYWQAESPDNPIPEEWIGN